MATLPASSKQVPDHSIMDFFNKQTYLGNQYSVPLTGLSVSGTEANIMLLSNPQTASNNGNGNGKSLFVNLRTLICLTTASQVIMRVYAQPTVTLAGSAATVVNLRGGYGVANSVAVATTTPTTSVRGTLIETLGTNTFVSTTSNTLIIIDPGQTILLTSQGSGAISANATVNWYEL